MRRLHSPGPLVAPPTSLPSAWRLVPGECGHALSEVTKFGDTNLRYHCPTCGSERAPTTPGAGTGSPTGNKTRSNEGGGVE